MSLFYPLREAGPVYSATLGNFVDATEIHAAFARLGRLELARIGRIHDEVSYCDVGIKAQSVPAPIRIPVDGKLLRLERWHLAECPLDRLIVVLEESPSRGLITAVLTWQDGWPLELRGYHFHGGQSHVVANQWAELLAIIDHKSICIRDIDGPVASLQVYFIATAVEWVSLTALALLSKEGVAVIELSSGKPVISMRSLKLDWPLPSVGVAAFECVTPGKLCIATTARFAFLDPFTGESEPSQLWSCVVEGLCRVSGAAGLKFISLRSVPAVLDVTAPHSPMKLLPAADIWAAAEFSCGIVAVGSFGGVLSAIMAGRTIPLADGQLDQQLRDGDWSAFHVSIAGFSSLQIFDCRASVTTLRRRLNFEITSTSDIEDESASGTSDALAMWHDKHRNHASVLFMRDHRFVVKRWPEEDIVQLDEPVVSIDGPLICCNSTVHIPEHSFRLPAPASAAVWVDTLRTPVVGTQTGLLLTPQCSIRLGVGPVQLWHWDMSPFVALAYCSSRHFLVSVSLGLELSVMECQIEHSGDLDLAEEATVQPSYDLFTSSSVGAYLPKICCDDSDLFESPKSISSFVLDRANRQVHCLMSTGNRAKQVIRTLAYSVYRSEFICIHEQFLHLMQSQDQLIDLNLHILDFGDGSSGLLVVIWFQSPQHRQQRSVYISAIRDGRVGHRAAHRGVVYIDTLPSTDKGVARILVVCSTASGIVEVEANSLTFTNFTVEPTPLVLYGIGVWENWFLYQGSHRTSLRSVAPGFIESSSIYDLEEHSFPLLVTTLTDGQPVVLVVGDITLRDHTCCVQLLQSEYSSSHTSLTVTSSHTMEWVSRALAADPEQRTYLAGLSETCAALAPCVYLLGASTSVTSVTIISDSAVARDLIALESAVRQALWERAPALVDPEATTKQQRLPAISGFLLAFLFRLPRPSRNNVYLSAGVDTERGEELRSAVLRANR